MFHTVPGSATLHTEREREERNKERERERDDRNKERERESGRERDPRVYQEWVWLRQTMGSEASRDPHYRASRGGWTRPRDVRNNCIPEHGALENV